MSKARAFIEGRFPYLRDQPLFPLLILFLLNAVDEFDSRAFLVLAPEIRDEFGLSVTGFNAIAGLTFILVLLGGLPVGFLGDRFRRTRLVIIAAALWATMSVTTGLATAIWVLVLARFWSGTGRVFNETVHSSLITDYYPQHLHGRIFGIHRAANPTGLVIAGLLVGTIAAAFGWRQAFFIVAVPTLLVTAVAIRLREPLRGEAEDATMAAEAAREKPIPLAGGWRWLFGVPSVKRFYIASFFGGGTVFALLATLNQFYDEVFRVDELGRGLITSVGGAAQLVGAILGGIAVDRFRTKGLGRISFLAGLAIFGIGGGVLITGAAPSLGVAIAGNVLTSFSIGLWTSPNISVLVIVLPARIRSLGIGMGLMFYGVGAFVLTIIAGIIADASGLRASITTLAPLLFVAGAVYLAAARFVNTDGQRALQALAMEVELRQERMTAGKSALLVCRSLDVAYDKVQVLFGVDFQVQQGEIVALLGTNGAGKSTLLRAISGALHPVGGAVFFEGENITFYEPHESAAAGIVQVPGGRGIFPSLTVRENIDTAAWLYRRDSEYVKKATAQVLSIFPVLQERWELKAGDLSGGEQQMVTLAQAFIAKPKLLMIDELTLGLAPKLVEQLLDAIRAFHRAGTTVILVEQSVNIALTVAQRAYFMEKGEIRFSGPASDLLGRTDLLRSVFLEGAARSGGDGHARAKTRRGAARTKSAQASATPSLEVVGLTKSYGGIRAVDEVSFSLYEGQILGVIGPNGAGKTTVFDLISGFLRPDSGKIIFLARDITPLSPDSRARLGLGRSFQNARLSPSMTVAENLALALDRHIEVKEPVAAALGLPHVRASERKAGQRVEELIEIMGLAAFRDKFVSELSTGSRRIVDIACSLAHQPKVLILDEPSSGIAQAETEALGPLLHRVRDDLGCGLLVIEHDIPLVSGLADELIALDLGREIARGTPSEVVRDPGVITAYLGTRPEGIRRSRASKPKTTRLRSAKTAAKRKRSRKA